MQNFYVIAIELDTKIRRVGLHTYVFRYTVLIIYSTMFQSCSLLPVVTFVLRTRVLWASSIFSGVNIVI
jgi:hypothetical protein